MYPLDFPHSYLAKYGRSGQWVLDPFCGRGTTNFAARLCGMPSVGLDSSPIATSIAQAKLAHTTPEEVLAAFDEIMGSTRAIRDTPEGEFWELAFEQATLEDLCRLRSELLRQCLSDERIVLRAILLGALHGPRNKCRRSCYQQPDQELRHNSPEFFAAGLAAVWKSIAPLCKEDDDAGAIAAMTEAEFVG